MKIVLASDVYGRRLIREYREHGIRDWMRLAFFSQLHSYHELSAFFRQFSSFLERFGFDFVVGNSDPSNQTDQQYQSRCQSKRSHRAASSLITACRVSRTTVALSGFKQSDN
jgi:hypothetical protein